LRWYTERLYPDLRTAYRVRRELCRKRSAFQHIRILDTERCGRMLVLDGITQTSEADEFIYHEMLVHVPLVAHGRCRRVLIVGGGDGGAAREVLRHPVERVVVVELDEEVVRCCRRHLAGLSRGAFDDPRLELVFEDAARYVRNAQERFDAVLVDSPDPVGPARSLFATRFYREVDGLLRPGGVMVRQAGSAAFQPAEVSEAALRVGRVFPHVRVYLAAVPTYVGGHFCFVMGSRSDRVFRVSPGRLQERIRRLGLQTRYYSAKVHGASFMLPGYVRELLR